MSEEKLPKGWMIGTIPDLITKEGVFSDGDWVESKDQDPNGDVRLIQLADIGDGVYRDKSERFLTTQKALELRCTFLKKGDILIARMPDPLGRACIFPLSGKFVTVVDVAIVRPTCNAKWLMYWINSPKIRGEIFKNASGSTRLRISRKNLSKIELPIPPLPEQQRIVTKLDAVFGHLDRVREKLDRIPELLKNFRQQVLTQAVTGELTREWRIEQGINQDLALEEGQKIVNLKKEIYKNESANFLDKLDDATKIDTSGSLFSEDWISVNPSFISSPERYSIGIGPFGSNLKVSDYTTEGHPLIFVRNVIANNFKELDPKFVSESKFLELIPHSVTAGDILITKMGTPPGDCEIYPENSKDGIITSDVLKVRVWKEYFVPKFYKFAISSSLVKEQIEGITKGVAHQKISLKRFKEIQLPFPTKNEQQEIVKRVDTLFGLADKIESQYQSLKAKIDQMPQAILAKAFRGELVEQEVKEYVREVEELGMVAEGMENYG